MKNRKYNIISTLIFFLGTAILTSIYWMKNNFGNPTMDSILFHLQAPLVGAEKTITNFVMHIFYAFLISLALYYTLKIVDKKIVLHNSIKIAFFSIYLVLCGIYTLSTLNVVNYLKKTRQATSFIQDNYYIPDTIAFSENKRNIIVLVLESLDRGFTKDSFPQSLLPHLETIQKNNVSFPKLQQTSGTGWTIAALTAMTLGVPLKLPIHGNRYEGNTFKYFLPGAKSILNVLEKNNYRINLILGSNSNFSGINNLFKTHALNSNIYDLDFFINEDKNIKITNWGLDDEQLYEHAKKIILKKSTTNEPFFTVIQTIDTHNPVPIVKSYPQIYGDSRDTILHADTMANNFIAWAKKQSFYENTTIIIIADHKLMNSKLGSFELKGKRYLYNAIVNSPFSMKKEYLQRQAIMFDLAPTILEIAGAHLPNRRFGLGYSLFYDEKNLLETLGAENLAKKLANRSKFYNSFFVEE